MIALELCFAAFALVGAWIRREQDEVRCMDVDWRYVGSGRCSRS